MYSYHDTTDERQRLDEFEEKAATQDEKVLAFMRAHAGRPFTPAEVWAAIDPERLTPLTSIRRAITNNTKAGNLKQLEGKKAGIYGRMNLTWVYPENAVQQKLF